MILVVLGGALGGLGRHGLDVLYPTTTVMFSTLTINVVGSALLAALPAIGFVARSPRLVLLVGPGALGGFTTLSAYSEQSRALAADGHVGLAAAYVVGSVAAALLAVLVVRRLTAPVAPGAAS